jgi:restriction system protein
MPAYEASVLSHQDSSEPLTFLVAAERILTQSEEPLTVSVITERAMASGLLVSEGKTPWATMEAQLATSIKRQADSPFIRTAPRTYGLRQWVAEGRITITDAAGRKDEVHVPAFPRYCGVRALLPVLDGVQRSLVTSLRVAIWEHVGTVEENVDWTDPTSWIPERLVGDYQELALRIWEGTNHLVNPRHMWGHWLFASGYSLLTEQPDGQLALTPRGQQFIQDHEGAVVRELDEREGVLKLLALVAEYGPTTSGELLESWMDYLKRVSRVRARSTARSFLYYRLRNLTWRGLIERTGIKYQVTPRGLQYLQNSGFAEVETSTPTETRSLWGMVTNQRAAVRAALHDRLSELDPYAFERLIKRLLEEIGYSDVEVTSRSGDKGVDVIGRIVVGITEVREVVQVKRQQGNIHRPILDMLRGSLHRFGAVRGTIITLGGFAKGTKEAAFEPGAAPITLINGEKLLDLLIENKVGVHEETLKVLKIDEDVFDSSTDEDEEPDA